MLPSPLQLILISKKAGDLIRDAIEGGFRGQGTGYTSGGDDLNVPIRRLSNVSIMTARAMLSEPLHTVVVICIDRELLADRDLVTWIDECGALIEKAETKHSFLLIDLDGSFEEFCTDAPRASWSQAMPVHQLGETAVQPTIATLIVLDLATKAVTGGSDLVQDKMKFFVSHAKMDGQPLARMLKDQIDRLPGFKGFYDADDIAPGTNWREVLKKGVQDSVVIVLHSKAFENRVWCIQEVHWAEHFGSPIVVVDLRNDLVHPPSQLNLAQSFSVRVPDGNIFRIIFVALREGLRARLHIRTVQKFIDNGWLPDQNLQVLVRRPTMLSLQAACNRVHDSSVGVIVYPDPALGDGEFEAANAIVSATSDKIWLTTPQSVLADPKKGGRLT